MRLIYSLLLVLVFVAVSHAKPITFTFEGQTSGYSHVLGGEFSSFIVTARADTSDRVLGHGLYSSLIAKSAEVELVGLGTIKLDNTPTQPDRLLIYGTGTTPPGPYLVAFAPGTNFFIFAPLATWDWNSSVGPFISTGSVNYDFVEWLDSEIDRSFPIPAIFTATVTPEPSSVILAAGSLTLLAFSRR